MSVVDVLGFCKHCDHRTTVPKENGEWKKREAVELPKVVGRLGPVPQPPLPILLEKHQRRPSRYLNHYPRVDVAALDDSWVCLQRPNYQSS